MVQVTILHTDISTETSGVYINLRHRKDNRRNPVVFFSVSRIIPAIIDYFLIFEGGIPYRFLNNLLKWYTSSYPTAAATS